MPDHIEPFIAIVDYGMGNLFSVYRACEKAGINAAVTHIKEDIEKADGLILPGVGAYGDAMAHLRQLGLVGPICDFASSGKPFFGICLGMQLLMTESEEFGAHKGLNIIPGKVKKLKPADIDGQKSKVPEVGWNRILPPDKTNAVFSQGSPLADINPGEYMYFVHSFYAQPVDIAHVLSTTIYEGVEYCSSVQKENIFATQFHPEKSAAEGLKIYQHWANIVRQSITERVAN